LIRCIPLTTTPGCVESIDVSGCGLGNEWILPLPIIASLPTLPELLKLCCLSDDEEAHSKLQLPPAQVCRGGASAIKTFFTHPDQDVLEHVAQSIASELDSSSATVAPVVIGVIKALLNQPLVHAPLMVQQLWVSLVSHKNSNDFAPVVEAFLDDHLDIVSAVINWKDHKRRTAETCALPFCKLAMSSRLFFLGLYDIREGLHYEYKSATCTVYIVDRVKDDKKMRVALKFMKNADEFEREKSSREQLLNSGCGLGQLQQSIVETTESYHFTDSSFQAALEKRRWLVDYDDPCLLVMPAAERNLRAIMDSEHVKDSGVIKSMFQEILNCTSFMHERNCVHGDLKPRNLVRILFGLKRCLMLIDFDASAQIGKQYSWSKHSSAYMPPEAIRLRISLMCSDFAVDASASTQHVYTVFFKAALPFDIAAGSAFFLSISNVNVTAVHSLIFDDTVDLSSCTSINDHIITVTAIDAMVAGNHTFKIVALFDGNLPAADSMSVRLEHDVDTLHATRGMNRDSLPMCTARVRNPMKDAKSSQSMPQPGALKTQLSASAAIQPINFPLQHSSHPIGPLTMPYPSCLSESVIEKMSSALRLNVSILHDGSVSPEVAKAASLIHNEYTDAVSNARRLMLSARQAWASLHQLSSRVYGIHQTATCDCTCDSILPTGARSGDVSMPTGCIGLCGIAHVGHDAWALGVILYRLSAKRSLWDEDDEDNIKDDSDHLIELALWTDEFKQRRLQNIDDTATRLLVSKLLEKEPWKRPGINDVLAMPFNEIDVIKLKLQQTVSHDASACSNLVGSVKDLRTGKFKDAALGMRHFLKVAADWDEQAACTLQGMQDEVDLLKDCPDCAQVQADVMLQLGFNEAAATQKLAFALAQLRVQRQHGAVLFAADVVKLRSEISNAQGWHYGMPNSITWPSDKVKIGSRTFCQPMCKYCQDYCLDYSSIFADLHYILHEKSAEKKEWNGIRDHGREGLVLADFMAFPQAKSSQLMMAELAALRFYTSHSFNSINIPMRDTDRKAPHPLPGIVTNIQRGLKKLRALGSDDVSSKQTVVLWRGMSYMQLPPKFKDEGGTELAPMSTTTDVSVAISYAVNKDTRSALLFRFVTRNNLERGADVQWLSMFPGESETLFPPLTFLQRTRTEPQEVVHNGVNVTVVELSTTLA
jgi:serine/threonine protein kinase